MCEIKFYVRMLKICVSLFLADIVILEIERHQWIYFCVFSARQMETGK
jgi:hypothetical protein